MKIWTFIKAFEEHLFALSVRKSKVIVVNDIPRTE